MPSGARLMSAILMALAMTGAVFIAAFHDTTLAPARDRLMMLAAAVGAFFGWGMLGGRLGKGFARSAGRSLATITIGFFWFFAILAMRSLWLSLGAGLYRGRPMEAMGALVERFMGFASYAFDIRVILAAAVGALIAGAIGEYSRMIWN